ncbi:MAG: VCBS repeat-containing protein [Bacteroidales bacterium]|nr:VCBS repeat-containing protein [Bacteroidales bacterium]
MILEIENIPCGGGSGTGDSIYSARPHLPDNVYACMSPCDCEDEYLEDLRTDARWGFLHSGKNKLRRILIYSGDSLARSYSFCYGADVFGRAQLQKIRQWNADCSGESWDHDLSYYEDIPQQFSVSDSVTVSNPASSIRISEKSCKNKELNLISRKLQITPSLLGSSRTWNAGIGGGFNIGLGKNVMNQEVTLELNLGGGGNWGKGLSTLTDVNGDGLPDAVYIRKDSVRYCLQTADRQFGNEQFLGVKRFLKDYSTNIHESIGANCIAHGSLGSEQSKHVTNVYFTDLNGDGLLDIVDKGRVKTVMQGYKPPVITVDTNCSEISICQGDAYQADEIVLPDLDYEEEHPLPELQPYDMVRFFVNQVCDRAMQIYAPVQFLPLGQGADSLEKDTVILSIEYYDTSRSFVVQQKMLTSDDLSLDWSGPLLTSGNPNLTNEARDFFFQGVNTCYYPTSECVFFFRVHPYNGRPIRHLLSWDPQIKYRNSCNSTEDVYSPHNLPAGAQLLQSDGTFYCPFRGKLHIKYEQTLNSTTLPTGQNISYTYSLSYNNVIIANHQLDENNSTIQYDTVLSVDTGVVLTFSVRSNDIWENMHLNQWRPNVYYDSICIDNVMTEVLDYEENSSDTFKYFNYYPVPKYDISDQLFYCVYHSPSVANENMFELQANTTLNILIDFQNQVINGRYTLYLVGDQGVLYRCTGTVNSSNISETASISNGYNGPLWLECVFDGIPATSLSYNSFIDGFNCICVIYDSSKRVSHPLHKSMYGQWGQFQYKNENNENLIDTNFFAKCGKQDTTRLKSLISQMMFDSTQFAQYDTTQYSLWRNEVTDIFKLLPLTANGETRRYEGVFPNSFIQDAIIGIGYLPDITEWLSDDEDADMQAEPAASDELRNSVLQDVSTRGRASRSGGKGCLLNKVSRSLNFNGNWSAMGMGQSASRSITYTTNDVMDLNGDGYPDIIHDGMVYYTKHKGVNWDFSSTSSIFSENNHLSKNYSIGNNFSAEPVKTVIVPNIRNKGMRTVIDGMPDISGGHTASEDRVEHTLADINGDGLPDLIYRNNTVRINTGYGFLPEKTWAGLSEIGVSTGTLQNVGVGDGTTLFAGASTDPKQPLSEWHASISGGLSLNKAQNEQITILLDINGDGLPDLVHKNSNGSIQYRLNTGISFDSIWHTWYGQTLQDWSTSLTIGGNAALTGGITYMGIKLCGSVAVNASYTKNSEEVQFTDFDGDGLPDMLSIDNDDNLFVRYARLGRTGLLKAVANPLGGSIVLDYEMTDANVFHSRRWVLKEVKLSDGLPGDGADTLTTRYGYQYGYYDHAERRFLGFAKVSTFEINTNGDTLRTTERFFANNNVHLAGQILAEVLYDSLHRRYVQTTHQISLDTLNTIGGAARVFPKLSRTQTCYFEGLPQAPVTKIQTFEYENTYGNLVRQSESSTDQDLIIMDISYHNSLSNYCVNIPKKVEITGYRKRETEIDSIGHIISIHDYYDNTHYLTTRMEYDSCGNITVLRSPNTATHYAYDAVAHTYPVSVTDTFGVASYMQDYDYRFGVPRTIIDRAGNRMEYTLDAWGRTLTVRGPKEIAANQPYTLRFSYYGTDAACHVPSTKTEHYDPQHPANPIKIYTYCDGLGRIVQTRKEAAVNGVEKLVISGLQQYDALGRAVKNYYPVETTLQDTAFAFVADNIAPATVVYDVLDRPLLQTAPDGSSTAFQYGFDGSHLGKMLFKTTTTDANHHSSVELKDVNGTPWAIKAAGQPFVYFNYNPVGDNTKVYSSQSNDWERNYTYDLLGRKLSYTEGMLAESFTYNGSNLATHTQSWVENTQTASKTTHYHYNAHRLDSVSYDDALSTIYHYDQYGRVDSLYDESGVMCYEYGNMGEVTQETRIYALPFLAQPVALTTQFRYDSWGRVDTLIYPDGEIVKYQYNCGGQLQSITNNSNYNYLDSVTYDKFGAKTSQKYDNGLKTNYTYNNITRRLSSIQTMDNNATLSSIGYTYDLVGNVTQVASTCPWLQNQSFTENFSYDSSDQLTAAQENQNNGYQLAVNYGNWGKIMQYNLAQTDMLNNVTESKSYANTYATQNNLPTTQTLFALYQQTGSEDVTFTFGINGSLRKREVQTPNPYTEYYLFNSQSNLKAYSEDAISFAYYGYNAANTRTYKISLNNTNVWINGQPQELHMQLQQATFYPNPYLNFDAFGNYTKHYYNGTERIASRLGENNFFIAIANNTYLESRRQQAEQQFLEDIQDLISETPQIDMPAMADALSLQPTGTANDIFYYHVNHLGSTSFVTNNNATITQGFLYAPFGEITTEFDASFGNNVIPKYAFNAKELDEETGMYYYEARYYAPPVFTSRDPMFEKYFWMTPYAYCANNPVNLIDPNGMCAEDPPSYYMNSQGFWIEGDESFGEYIGNIAPNTDRYR